MVKRERKVGSVLVDRNALQKNKRDSLWGKIHTLMDTFTHAHELRHADASGKRMKSTKFVFCIFLSFHPNLDAFPLWTQGLVPISQGSDNHWPLQRWQATG